MRQAILTFLFISGFVSLVISCGSPAPGTVNSSASPSASPSAAPSAAPTAEPTTESTVAPTPLPSTTPDGKPPRMVVALAQVSGNVIWVGSATISEAGWGYCTALTGGSAAPTPAEVKRNDNANAVGATSAFRMTRNTSGTCSITGLTLYTAYDFYFVATDQTGNLQQSVSGPVSSVVTH